MTAGYVFVRRNEAVANLKSVTCCWAVKWRGCEEALLAESFALPNCLGFQVAFFGVSDAR
jgi:hypothetical protein